MVIFVKIDTVFCKKFQFSYPKNAKYYKLSIPYLRIKKGCGERWNITPALNSVENSVETGENLAFYAGF